MEGFYNHAKQYNYKTFYMSLLIRLFFCKNVKQYDHKTQSLDENLSIDFRNHAK